MTINNEPYRQRILAAARRNDMQHVVISIAEYISTFDINIFGNPFYAREERFEYPYQELFDSIFFLLHGIGQDSHIEPKAAFADATYNAVWHALYRQAEFPRILNPNAISPYSFKQIVLYTVMPFYLKMHKLTKAQRTMPKPKKPAAIVDQPTRPRSTTESSTSSHESMHSDTSTGTTDTVTASLEQLRHQATKRQQSPTKGIKTQRYSSLFPSSPAWEGKAGHCDHHPVDDPIESTPLLMDTRR
jgi:hypothetical protein